MKHINVLEDVLVIGGVAVSLSMIQTILGIVILSCQVVLIITKAIIKIVNLYKQKRYKEIEDTLNDAKGELENLKDKVNDKQD